jgi:TolB-like protein
MGEVYIARDTKLDRRVAIKVLSDEMARDSSLRARFVREAKALAALSHPNILAIHDFGEAAGIFYAVTELLEGDTLAGRLKAGRLPARMAAQWALQIARGSPLHTTKASCTAISSRRFDRGPDADQRRGSGAPRSIAVLPFTDMSPGKDQDYFCEGMAEEIINALTGVAGLRVAARSSAFRFKAGERDLREIGRTLDVSLVLEGSVRTAGNRLRVTAQLNEAHSGYQVWSRGLDDVFATQDEIAADIVKALAPDLGSAAAPLIVRHADNQEAYNLFLRGRHHWYARSRGALQKALRYFEEATEKDPDYALPYVGLADLYTVQALYFYEPPETVRPRARAAVQRALAINDRVPDAYRALGFIQLFEEWDVRSAVRSFERSIELDASSALSHIWLGWPSWPGPRVGRACRGQARPGAGPAQSVRKCAARHDSRLLGPWRSGHRGSTESARHRSQLPRGSIPLRWHPHASRAPRRRASALRAGG